VLCCNWEDLEITQSHKWPSQFFHCLSPVLKWVMGDDDWVAVGDIAIDYLPPSLWWGVQTSQKKRKAFQAHPVSITELVQELVRIQEVVFCRWIKPSKTSYNNSPLRQDPAQEPMITLSGTLPIWPGQHQAIT